MVGIQIQPIRDTISPQLRELLRRLAHPKVALTEIGRNLVASSRNRFKQSRGPIDGLGEVEPWEELAESTVEQRRHGKGKGSPKPLIDTSSLLRSVQARVDSGSLHVGTNHEIAPDVSAAIHQLGGENWMAPGPAAIPAREFLGVDAEDTAMMERVAAEYLGEGMLQ